MCEKSVLDPIPHKQHRPICVTVNPVIVPQPTTSRRFIELLRVVSRRHIPRGCRSNYMPGIMEESKSLYEAYKRQYLSNPFGEGTLETGTKLIDTMKEHKSNKWEKGITSSDLTRNSRKAWHTIRKLSNDQPLQTFCCTVTIIEDYHHIEVRERLCDSKEL